MLCVRLNVLYAVPHFPQGMNRSQSGSILVRSEDVKLKRKGNLLPCYKSNGMVVMVLACIN